MSPEELQQKEILKVPFLLLSPPPPPPLVGDFTSSTSSPPSLLLFLLPDLSSLTLALDNILTK